LEEEKLVALIGVAGVSCQVASVWQLGQGAAFAKLTRGRRVADGFFWFAIAQARLIRFGALTHKTSSLTSMPPRLPG